MSNPQPETKMEKIISLCKRRGFVFPGSEIYGGLAGTFDYGPYGVALKNNVKRLWWKRFVEDREDVYGLDAAIIMNPKAWEASGHVAGFSDPMVECLNTKCKNRRHRVDHLLGDVLYSEVLKRLNTPEVLSGIVKSMTSEIKKVLPKDSKESFPGESEFLTRKETEKRIDEFETKKTGIIMQTCLMENKVKCPGCGQIDWGIPKQFNMMFKTQIGATEDPTSLSYLRPETAGGIFVNYKNVLDSLHPKLPFGIAQIGKAFRNEIAPRDFIFRLRELEQMEIEFFVDPKEWEKWFTHFQTEMHAWMKDIGLTSAHIHEHEIAPADLAHYSKRTIDIEFDYPFGQKELYGLAYRTDFDLKAHTEKSRVDLSYFDEESKTRFVPHVIEPSFGVDRTVLAILSDAYTEDTLGGESRTFLKLAPQVAPIRAAVFPLLKNKPELVAKAREVYLMLKKVIPNVEFDDNGNIGKRYRRQDEIGTPYCITVDFDTLTDGAVTLRDRDSGEQKRVKIEELAALISRS